MRILWYEFNVMKYRLRCYLKADYLTCSLKLNGQRSNVQYKICIATEHDFYSIGLYRQILKFHKFHYGMPDNICESNSK